jgi:signal transduction histidine kinase
VQPDTLERLAPLLSGEALAAGVRWIAATVAASGIAADVERSTRRINDMVSAVRSYAHMDRPPLREPTDIAKGLGDTVAVLLSEANARGATLSLEVPAQLPLVSAVGPDLNQVWANLVHNALDAAGTGGEVSLSAAVENGSVVVRVIDNGEGIAPEIRSRVFDPFFTTKPVGAGVGLGLDIVRRIVGTHSGDVEFDSRPGRTEFVVRLPAAAVS